MIIMLKATTKIPVRKFQNSILFLSEADFYGYFQNLDDSKTAKNRFRYSDLLETFRYYFSVFVFVSKKFISLSLGKHQDFIRSQFVLTVLTPGYLKDKVKLKKISIKKLTLFIVGVTTMKRNPHAHEGIKFFATLFRIPFLHLFIKSMGGR